MSGRLSRWAPIVVGAVGLAIALLWMYGDKLFLAPGPPLATVEKVSGELRSDGQPLAEGGKAGKGERLEVANNARAKLRLPSGETIVLSDGASLELMKLDPHEASELWLHKGTLRAVASERRPSPIVYTHEVTATALKARFEISASEGVTAVRVAHGKAHVEGLHKTLITVGGGQRVVIKRGDELPPSQAEADPTPLPDRDE